MYALEVDEYAFQLVNGNHKVLNIDNDLRNLTEVLHRIDLVTYVLGNVRDEQAVQRLSGRKRRQRQGICRISDITYSTEYFIDPGSPVRNTFNELIELIHEIPDVDAAHGESLRER